jgi:hypothetical protein
MVHFLAIPLGNGGVGGDVQTQFPVLSSQRHDVPAETCIRTGWNDFAIG